MVAAGTPPTFGSPSNSMGYECRNPHLNHNLILCPAAMAFHFSFNNVWSSRVLECAWRVKHNTQSDNSTQQTVPNRNAPFPSINLLNQKYDSTNPNTNKPGNNTAMTIIHVAKLVHPVNNEQTAKSSKSLLPPLLPPLELPPPPLRALAVVVGFRQSRM